MAFRNRFLIVTLGVLCFLTPQVLLQYSPGVFGIGVRCLFVVSDVIALLGIIYGQKSAPAWRSYAILYAVRCAATIPLILWLRSVTGSYMPQAAGSYRSCEGITPSARRWVRRSRSRLATGAAL